MAAVTNSAAVTLGLVVVVGGSGLGGAAVRTGSWPPAVPAAGVVWPGNRFAVGPSRRALARSSGRVLLVEVDTSGIRMPACRLHVGWQEISEIRVVSLRRKGLRGRHRVVVFLPYDPASVLARIPGRRARAARRSQDRYRSPIAISDRDLDCGAEEIVAAAGILAPLTLNHPN